MTLTCEHCGCRLIDGQCKNKICYQVRVMQTCTRAAALWTAPPQPKTSRLLFAN